MNSTMLFSQRFLMDKFSYHSIGRGCLSLVLTKNAMGNISFNFDLSTPAKKPRIGDILEKNVDSKYTLSPHLWKYLQDYAEKHHEKGNGFGYGLISPGGVSRTLSARYYKDGSEILIPQEGKCPRRLTPRECARLQGYPDSFKITVSDTQAYKQFGNSVVVSLVKAVAGKIIEKLSEMPENSYRSETDERTYSLGSGNTISQ